MAKLFGSPILAITCLVYIFSSTAQAAGAVLGVDLGTEYIKAALVKPGIPLEIVLTKDSRRKELSAVTFKPSKSIKSGEFPERLYGSDAVALSARFPQDVYPNLKALLGLPVDSEAVKEYASRHPALKLETDKTRGTVAFKSSSFAPDELAWTVEEILAMELQSIQKAAEAMAGKHSSVKDLVITIPPFYTAEEKRAVLLAADLAGLRVLELISDGLAVGLNYATSRTFPSINEGGKAEQHLVFDMGAGSTKATILRFQGRTVKDVGRFNKTIQEVQVLGSGWDRTLGGDLMNGLIMDDMIAQFIATPAAKKASVTLNTIKGHGRATAKLWKESERLRQILSANANTQTGFEGLYEEVNFKYKITRAEFETLAEPYVIRIASTIQDALNVAGLTINDLDSVILNGGATRTPFVQKELEKIMGSADKIRTNVNSDEAAVFGAGFRGAVLSPSFRVKDIRAFEGASYAAAIKWKNNKGKEQVQKLWKASSHNGAEKQYTFSNHADFDLSFYQDVASSGEKIFESRDLLTVSTSNLTATIAHLKEKWSCADADIQVKMTTRLALANGEPEVVKFTAECEVDKEKAGVVDSIKGAFGFGKKDQDPLSDGEETTTTTVTDDSTSTKSSSSSSAKESKDSKKKDGKSKDKKEKPAVPTKRQEIVPIAFTTKRTGVPALSETEFARQKDRLVAFEASDKARRLREEALNQLEGFTYKVREHLDNEDFVAASTEAEREKIETLREAASEWIYSGGVSATREELKAKYNEINDLVKPVSKRVQEKASRPAKIEALETELKDAQGVIDRVLKQIGKEEQAIESWSSSKSASSVSVASSTTTSESSKTTTATSASDFEGLEDEESTTTTTTSSTVVEEEAIPTVHFPATELVPLQKLHSDITSWLATSQKEQSALAETAEPTLTVSALEAKIKQLADARLDVVIRSLKIDLPKPKKKPVTKPKTKKKKTTATKKGDKTASAAPGQKTIDLDDILGPNGEMPSDEELQEFFRKASDKQKEGTAGAEGSGSQEEMKDEPVVEKQEEGEKKHDEL